MKNNQIHLSIKKAMLVISWLIIYYKINFGVIRSAAFRELLANNQILLNLIMILVVYVLCKQELNHAIKEVNLYMFKNVGIALIALLLIDFVYMFVVFDRVEIAPQKVDFFFLIASIIIAPLSEELIYRYLFLSLSDSKWIKLVLGIVSTSLFFYAHRFAYDGNLLAMIQILFLTVGSIYLYLKTKNIFSAVALHTFYNLVIIVVYLICN